MMPRKHIFVRLSLRVHAASVRSIVLLSSTEVLVNGESYPAMVKQSIINYMLACFI